MILNNQQEFLVTVLILSGGAVKVRRQSQGSLVAVIDWSEVLESFFVLSVIQGFSPGGVSKECVRDIKVCEHHCRTASNKVRLGGRLSDGW